MAVCKSLKRRSISSLIIVAAFAGVASAQAPLLEEVHTLGAEGAIVPFERTFVVAGANNYEVTLTDLGAPGAALASVRLAVTQGTTIIGTPLLAPGAMTIAGLASTTYSIRVTGAPGAAVGSGLFRVDVRNLGSGDLVDSFVGILAPPPGTPAVGQFLLDAPLSVANSGNYDVALRDLQLPQPIETLLLAVVEEGGPLVAALDTDPSTANPAQQTVALDASRQYRAFAIAVPTTPTSGGMYAVDVVPVGGGTAALARVVPVGGVTFLGSMTLAAGAHTLSLQDLGFPTALANRAALVMRAGQSVAVTTAAGNVPFTAIAGPHEIYAFGAAAAGAIAGSLNVAIAPTGQPAVFNAAHIAALPGSGVVAYTYDAPIANAAAFRVRLADYQFPAAFVQLRLAAAQNGAIVGTQLVGPGSFDISPTQGRVQLLVVAQAAAAGGLFGTDVSPVALGAVAFETTQGVGSVFVGSRFVVNNSASFAVRLTDVEFPARFTTLSAAVTRGADRVGLIFGGGTFNFDATPGSYFLNVIARPDAAEKAGTYGASVTQRPPPPVVTLTATPERVGSGGGAVDLTWSSQSATSCQASGGWTGARAISGTERTGTFSVATTFTLACTGAGGTTTQSVQVRIADTTGGGGGGGGGRLDLLTLLLAALFVVSRLHTRRRVAFPRRS